MEKYVLGFLFNEELDEVVLIRKNRPEWQAGKFNGVGGKVNPGEDIIAAMDREFWEETGVKDVRWELFGRMGSDSSWACWLFYAVDTEALGKVVTKTDEEVKVVNKWEIFSTPIIQNLRWLVPLVVDSLSNYEKGGPIFIDVSYDNK